jgi:hypothetical protein
MRGHRYGQESLCEASYEGRPNQPLELAPLRGPKIASILKVGNHSTALPSY